MKLTEQQKVKFVAWLDENATSDFKCNVCTGADFGVLDELVYLPTGESTAYPMVGVICTGCKNTNLFNVAEIDLTTGDEPVIAVVCQKCFKVEAAMQKDDGEYLCSDCYNRDV